MSQEKIALKEHETPLIKVQNNNTNNTQINNNNVTMNILPYEQTDVSHLFDRDYRRAFNRAPIKSSKRSISTRRSRRIIMFTFPARPLDVGRRT